MLKLTPNPTFWSKVQIPVAGIDRPIEIKVKFKHMPVKQFKEYMENVKGKDDLEIFTDLVEDWEQIDAPFSKENVEILLSNYSGITLAIFNKYIEENLKAKPKN